MPHIAGRTVDIDICRYVMKKLRHSHPVYMAYKVVTLSPECNGYAGVDDPL